MSYVKLPEFDQYSITPTVCFVMGVPRQKYEKVVFRLGHTDGDQGFVEISEQVVRSMAADLGMKDEKAVGRAHQKHNDTVCELREEIEGLQEMVDQLTGNSPTVRQLSRELDFAEAKADDAIRQFQEAERRIKELEAEEAE